MIEKIGTKKIIITMCIIILILILFMVGAFIYNKLYYKKSYSEIENIMVNSAKKYYTKNKDRLPNNEGDITSIEVNELVKQNYMKDISSYLKNDKEKCTGKVNVTKINKDYKYTPKLECTNYNPKYLAEHIKEKVTKVKSGEGLYELNNELVYRGENINNYLTFAGYNWRIVKVANDKVKIIFDDEMKDAEAIEWDDRYNEEAESEVGKNDYKVSRIKESLEKLYLDEKMFSKKDRLSISTSTVEIGKRNITDQNKTGAPERSELLDNQYLSLLPVYDYLNASIDENCKSIETKSCNNYNYLAKSESSWWFVTASTSNSYQVYKFDGDTIDYYQAASQSHIRPVLSLTEDTFYVSGNGSKDNPYKIK